MTGNLVALFDTRRIGVVISALAAWWLISVRPAFAHESQVIEYGSFLGGFTHPVLGLDHFLAMVGVGIVSSMLGGRAIWAVPGLFVLSMSVGALLGRYSGSLQDWTIEGGIAASVVLIGAAMAGARRIPAVAVAVAVAFFGLFHGYAHGAEIPEVAEPGLYAAGFLAGTVLIHLLGVLIGEVARRYAAGTTVLRVAGVAFAATGVLFLLGVL